jgi:hypothetical protein
MIAYSVVVVFGLSTYQTTLTSGSWLAIMPDNKLYIERRFSCSNTW